MGNKEGYQLIYIYNKKSIKLLLLYQLSTCHIYIGTKKSFIQKIH